MVRSGSTREGVSESGGVALRNDDAMRACGEQVVPMMVLRLRGSLTTSRRYALSSPSASVIGASWFSAARRLRAWVVVRTAASCHDSLMIFGACEAIFRKSAVFPPPHRIMSSSASV